PAGRAALDGRGVAGRSLGLACGGRCIGGSRARVARGLCRRRIRDGRLRLGRLLLPAAATGLPRWRLRRGKALRERGCDLRDRPELLTRAVERAVRARRVALGRREQGGADGRRQRRRDPDELRDVVLVTVPTRVRHGAEEPFGLRELLARLAVEGLANGA